MELQKYFDAPYQEEYSAHKQVFFVERKLKGMNENPLNALKHNPTAELEINLENPKYRLLFNLQAKGGVRIDVKVNGKPRLNKDRVRRKEELVITWSKPFYNTKEIRGRWNEISSDYLIKDDSEQKLTVVEIDLYPIEYTFIFETKDRFFNTINDAEIILKCKGYGPELNVKENKTFINFSNHFNELGLPVPEVYKVNAEYTVYLQQDLGMASLLEQLEQHGQNDFVYYFIFLMKINKYIITIYRLLVKRYNIKMVKLNL